MLTAFLLLLALVVFLVAAFWTPEPNRGKMACIGLACVTLAELLRGIGPGIH